MIILRVEVVLDFLTKVMILFSGITFPFYTGFFLFHELSILERSIAVRRACYCSIYSVTSARDNQEFIKHLYIFI